MTSEHDGTSRRLQQLEQRVDRLESAHVRVACLGVALLLVAGVLMPYGTERHTDEDDVSWSILSTPINTLREGIGREDGPGVEDILFLVGFIGLCVVVIGLLAGLTAIAGRMPSARTLTVLRVLLVLAGIGAAVVLFLTLVVLDDERSDAGYGGLVLMAGVIAYAALISERGRRWRQEPAQPRT